jgi:two-component system, sensor histidine kinase LadS
VTEPARFSRALDVVVWALIAALLGAAAVDSFVMSRASFGLLMALILVALVLVAGLIALVWAHGDDAHIRVIALGFLPVMVAAVFPVLRGLNLIPATSLTRYALSAGAALEMPILFTHSACAAACGERRSCVRRRCRGRMHSPACRMREPCCPASTTH